MSNRDGRVDGRSELGAARWRGGAGASARRRLGGSSKAAMVELWSVCGRPDQLICAAGCGFAVAGAEHHLQGSDNVSVLSIVLAPSSS